MAGVETLRERGLVRPPGDGQNGGSSPAPPRRICRAMPDVTLTAEPRTEHGSGPAGRLRRTGKVPAVVYGLDADAQSVTVVGRDLERILHGAGGANTLITLHLGTGDDALALVRQIQRNPTRGDLVHVDFVSVRR